MWHDRGWKLAVMGAIIFSTVGTALAHAEQESTLRAHRLVALSKIPQMRKNEEASAESRPPAKPLDPYCWPTTSPPPARFFAAITKPARPVGSASANDEGPPADLQQLIDNAPPGSVVKVPAGNYDRPIKIDRPLTLKGESREQCVLTVTANEPAVFISSRNRVTIESVTIKWQLETSQRSENPSCAVAVKDGQATLRDCRVLPLGNSKRCPTAVQCLGFSNVDLRECWFEGFEFTIAYSGGSEGRIFDCVVLNPGHCGITVYAGSTIEVAGNIVTGSAYHGLRCTGGTLKAHDNLVIANKNRGFYLGNKSAHGVLANNVIQDNATGISAFGGSDVLIKNNLIRGSSYAGLDTRDSMRDSDPGKSSLGEHERLCRVQGVGPESICAWPEYLLGKRDGRRKHRPAG